MRPRVGFIVALALSAAACPAGTPKPPATPTNDTPRPGGTLRLAIRDLVSLDPAKAGGTGTFNVVDAVFDSLLDIDDATGDLKPAAAESWKVSKDQRTWRLTLGDGRYSDGSRVTAKDFERAFDRIVRKSTKSDAAFQLEQVVGFRAAHTVGNAKTLAGVSAKGRVLTIKLSRPFAEFGYHLAHPALAPLAPLYRKSRKGLSTRPLGNGPFVVESVSLGRSATLTRNERDGGDGALLERLEFSVVSRTDGWAAFNRGEVEVAEIPSSQAAAERNRFAAGGSTPAWAMLGFGFNLDRAKYKSVTLRRAIALAIDRTAIARDVYLGTKDPATGLIPEGMRGYRPDACCGTDQDRARELLASLKGKKPSIRVDHLDDQASTDVAKAVVADLRDVGLKASHKSYTAKALTKLFGAGKHDFAENGWIADVPTPDGFLAQQVGKGSANNQTGFADKTFESLLRGARAKADASARLALYQKAESRALSRMPLVPIVFFRNQTAIAPNVRGLTLDGAGQFDARRVWLAAS